MLANLPGGAVGGLTQVAAATGGNGGIPFAITGTAWNPNFVPDMGGVVGGYGARRAGQRNGGEERPGERKPDNCDRRPARKQEEVGLAWLRLVKRGISNRQTA